MTYFVIGSKNWPKWLSNSLNKYGYKTAYLEYVSFLAVLKLFYVKSDFLIRVGYRLGILKPQCLLLDLFTYIYSILKGKKVVIYWTGSDIQRTSKAMKRSRYTSVLVSIFSKGRFIHITAAPWLVEELKDIGIDAIFHPFPVELNNPASMDKRKKFEVLTYIPDLNYKNYHGDIIYRVAKSLPDICFNVMGGNGYWIEKKLSNLKFLGWVEDTNRLYADNVLVLRIVSHDALGGTVREALANGCYVIYTFPHKHTIQVRPDLNNIVSAITSLKKQFISEQINVNHDAISWVNATLGEKKLVKDLVDILSGEKK